MGPTGATGAASPASLLSPFKYWSGSFDAGSVTDSQVNPGDPGYATSASAIAPGSTIYPVITARALSQFTIRLFDAVPAGAQFRFRVFKLVGDAGSPVIIYTVIVNTGDIGLHSQIQPEALAPGDTFFLQVDLTAGGPLAALVRFTAAMQ